MFPDSQRAQAQIGADAAALLRGVASWTLRRKETIEFLDERLVRRRMSVDYRLPPWLKPIQRASSGEPIFYAPLFFLQKGSDNLPAPGPVLVEPEPHFARFDLRDTRDRTMLLPPRTWNARVSVAALHAAAAHASSVRGLPLPDVYRLEAIFDYITSKQRNEALLMLAELRSENLPGFAPLRALVDADSDLAWLLAACAVSSIAPVALVGPAALEGVVKLSYNEQIQEFTPDAYWGDPSRDPNVVKGFFGRYVLPITSWLGSELGWTGYRMMIDSPFIGASTYHVEVPAPEGMEIYDAGVVAVSEADGTAITSAHRERTGYELQLARGSKVTSEVHLYAPRAGDEHGAFTWIDLRARRQGFLSGAFWASLFVTSVLYAGWRLEDKVTAAPRGIAELLLIFPALVATYAARPDAHRLTSRRLRFARALLVLVAIAPFVAAAAYALEPRDDAGRAISDEFATWWWWLGVGSAACTVALLMSRLLPITRLRRQTLRAKIGLGPKENEESDLPDAASAR